jgi:hypothetical protein
MTKKVETMNQITSTSTNTILTPKYLIITAMLNISLWMVRSGLAIVSLALIIVCPWVLFRLDEPDELVENSLKL